VEEMVDNMYLEKIANMLEELKLEGITIHTCTRDGCEKCT